MFCDIKLLRRSFVSRRWLLPTTILLCFVSSVGARTTTQGEEAKEPPFHAFKGVKIGMSAAEARQKLGASEQQSDQQDLYTVSDKETVQVYYDADKKVSAIAIIYLGADSGAPTAREVLGSDVEAKADGSMYKLVRYPKAGYWVSYSRTPGDTALTSVTIQKMR